MTDRLKDNPLLIAALAVSMLLTVGVLTFAGPCIHEDGSAAACSAAAQALATTGVIAALAALGALFASNNVLSGMLSFICAASGIFAAGAPGTAFGLCMMQTMRCWTIMRPFALVCGVVLFVCALIAGLRIVRRKVR